MSARTQVQRELAHTLSYSKSFLRRETYIRNSGILLTLSPLGNFFWSAALSGVPHWYQPQVLLAILRGVSGVLWFLWGSAFLAGLLMLKGKRSSWTFTLCIIGMNVVFGIISFKRDIVLGWAQPTTSLMINIGLFALIYTQEFHQRLERKLWQARLNRPFALAVQSELKVHFDGIGPWAKITEITNTGIRVQSLDGTAPPQIEYRTIELALNRELALKARFSARISSDYVFRFTNMTPSSLAALHRWARRVAATRPVQPAAVPARDFNSPAA